MATYRIVDMYRERKAVNGVHYDSWNEPIYAYRVDKRHSLLFGLIHYWDHGAYNLCPEYLFPSIDKAKEAILKVDKGRVTILYEQFMKLKIIKLEDKKLNPEKLFDVVYRGCKVIYEKKLHERWFNLPKSISV